MYLRFPAKEQIKQKWLDFINENGLNSNNLTKNSLICSAHFESTCFDFSFNQNIRILKKTAVPTYIITRVKHVSFVIILYAKND